MQRNKKINCLLNKKNNVRDEKKRREDKEKVKNIRNEEQLLVRTYLQFHQASI